MDISVSTLELRRLAAFGKLLRDDAERDLACLHDGGHACDSIDVAYERVHAQNGAASELIGLLQGRQHPNKSNSGLQLSNEFESLRELYGQIHAGMSEYAAVAGDDAHARLLNELAEVHDKLNTLAWLIGEIEADGSRSLPGTYNSADDMFAAIGL